MSDQEIVEGCIARKASAQKTLYEKYSAKMMAICSRYMNSKEDAQDVLQEAFIKVFNNIEGYEGKGPLGGWIRMIMINTALIHLRKDKKWAYMEDVSEVQGLSTGEETIVEALSAEELMRIINSMPSGYRTVFNLYAVEGYKHKEIAEQLSITESTSKTQYRKARSYVQKMLEKLEQTI